MVPYAATGYMERGLTADRWRMKQGGVYGGRLKGWITNGRGVEKRLENKFLGGWPGDGWIEYRNSSQVHRRRPGRGDLRTGD